MWIVSGLPGEGTHVQRVQTTKNGIPMPPALLAALDQLAGELKIEKLSRGNCCRSVLTRRFVHHTVGENADTFNFGFDDVSGIQVPVGIGQRTAAG